MPEFALKIRDVLAFGYFSQVGPCPKIPFSIPSTLHDNGIENERLRLCPNAPTSLFHSSRSFHPSIRVPFCLCLCPMPGHPHQKKLHQSPTTTHLRRNFCQKFLEKQKIPLLRKESSLMFWLKAAFLHTKFPLNEHIIFFLL